MSADLEQYVRRRVNEPESTDVEPWEAREDRELAIAYRKLCERCNHKGMIRGPTAKKLLAQAAGSVDQDDAYRLLTELASRGYIKLVNEIPPSDYFAVYVRPFSRRVRSRGATAHAD